MLALNAQTGTKKAIVTKVDVMNGITKRICKSVNGGIRHRAVLNSEMDATYGREGKWLTDISPYLFMLEDNDNRTFKYQAQRVTCHHSSVQQLG